MFALGGWLQAQRPAQAIPPAGLATAALSLQGLCKRYGATDALLDVSLDVPGGALVCLLGPSGCGKTTLLRVIAGLETPDRGQVYQFGRDITRAAPAARDYGIVFQSYALFPNLTVADNVAYGLARRGMARAHRRQRVGDMLALVGLTGFEARYPSQLSGGQQQRVALARALATSPGLLLLDEPLSALDAKVREHLRGEIRALQRRLGLTTVMVTHDQEEALTMADIVVVMNRGAIVQVGTPHNIYRAPSCAFVADFVGRLCRLPARIPAPGEVELCGLALPAPAAEGFAVGTPVEAGFRPEDLSLHPGEDSFVLLGELRALVFHGSFLRAGVALADGREFQADMSPAEAERCQLREGVRFRFHLPARRLRLFPLEP